MQNHGQGKVVIKLILFRARACWVLHYFSDVKYNNEDVLREAFRQGCYKKTEKISYFWTVYIKTNYTEKIITGAWVSSFFYF